MRGRNTPTPPPYTDIFDKVSRLVINRYPFLLSLFSRITDSQVIFGTQKKVVALHPVPRKSLKGLQTTGGLALLQPC